MVKTCQTSYPMSPRKTGLALSLIFWSADILLSRYPVFLASEEAYIHFQVSSFGKGLFGIIEMVVFILKINKKQTQSFLGLGRDEKENWRVGPDSKEEVKEIKLMVAESSSIITWDKYLERKATVFPHLSLPPEPCRRGRYTAESSFGEQQEKAVSP